MQTVDFEYGQGVLSAELPDDAQIFIPGVTVKDPPALEDPVASTRIALQNPLGMPTISELVGPGSKVTICFPDIVKGGAHITAHRKISIAFAISACIEAGVRPQDIKLICAIGLHRKNTDEEIRELLGEEIFLKYHANHQITNHDAEDRENIVDLGYDALGDRVLMNREVFESDLAILIGHVLGNPYSGYSGGYKMAATGITTWECIASHHNPDVMHGSDFTPVNPHSTMQNKMDAIGKHMESEMGRKFFFCDAVLDSQMRQIAVYAGDGERVQQASWEVAEKRTFVPFAEEKFDIMMFGMPQKFHYGNGHGTNPILMLQAIAANVVRHSRVMNDNFVVICSSICNGYFNDQEFPSYRELYELFQGHSHNTLPDVARYAEYHCSKQEYLDKYRFNFGYHPFHPFSMIACGHIAEKFCSAVYIVGAYEPGYARGMGMKTRGNFGEALLDAERYVGIKPRILALPQTFKTAAVHLTMKSQK
jgi:lactate racemase